MLTKRLPLGGQPAPLRIPHTTDLPQQLPLVSYDITPTKSVTVRTVSSVEAEEAGRRLLVEADAVVGAAQGLGDHQARRPSPSLCPTTPAHVLTGERDVVRVDQWARRVAFVP
ncbi:hypothetical protein GCM10010307_75870 [Streptomyces vastus]|uniref:Uncharacterized protein n=1 Tax=Streptomyces vastus TaxID=285451 RepID=A0ABN3RS28_9ACTN